MNRIFKLRNGLVFFIGIRTTEYITNVHRLHLMGAMQAIIEGKGIPCGGRQAFETKNVGKKLHDIMKNAIVATDGEIYSESKSNIINNSLISLLILLFSLLV